ncbi:MAG: type IV toxin-antitoxin system AbiEi family antitoxin [Candidatus Izemoplasmatales bacterium]|nr:type IV toxin-antitoxin system AbiEi family antitoxin [Candidatus Izemoplasmatales bacterium]
MNLLKEVSKYPVFNMEMVERLTGNLKTAYSAMNRYIKKGYVIKVRKNIYSPVDLSTGLLLANRYQIACALREDAYLSHHSALEYHGLSNQVFNDVYVSSKSRFNHFEFQGVLYKYVAPKINVGIIFATNTDNIRLTDIERTIIDSIYQMNKITGYEELSNAIEALHHLDEEKLFVYLKAYDIQSLYQKSGYILEKYHDTFGLTNHFFEMCKSKIKQGIVYLVDDSSGSKFNNTWQVMEPAPRDYGGDEIV